MGEGVSGRLRVAAWALARERETAWSENASCWSPLAGAAARSSSTPSAASYPLRARTRVRLRECAQYRVSVWRHRIPPHACVCAQTNMVPPEPPHTHTYPTSMARTHASTRSQSHTPTEEPDKGAPGRAHRRGPAIATPCAAPLHAVCHLPPPVGLHSNVKGMTRVTNPDAVRLAAHDNRSVCRTCAHAFTSRTASRSTIRPGGERHLSLSSVSTVSPPQKTNSSPT